MFALICRTLFENNTGNDEKEDNYLMSSQNQLQ